MAAKASSTTYIVGDRLPWPDDSSVAARLGPLEPGAIYDAAVRTECSVRRISALGATVRANLGKRPGDVVSVELGTGQRPSATIAWVAGGEAGVSFSKPVDVLALINRALINQPAERRSMPRVEIRCPVSLRWAGRSEGATLRNISANGMQVQGEELPGPGTYLSMFIEGIVVPAGEVVWRRNDLAGIELFEELSWTSILPWIRTMMRKGAD